MELKRINFLNFDTLKKALSDKEASLVKGTAATKKQGDEETQETAAPIRKEALDGKLPKNVLRLALVAACADAKSQLRCHNLNHLLDALMKRFARNYFQGLLVVPLMDGGFRVCMHTIAFP